MPHIALNSDALLPWAFPSVLLAAVAMLLPFYRTYSIYLETSILLLYWLALRGALRPDDALLYLPIVTTFLVSLAHARLSRMTAALAAAAVIAYAARGTWACQERFLLPHTLIVISSLLTCALLLARAWQTRGAQVRHIDCILATYSGNTAHYARHFIEGARDAGAEVTEHRLHFRRTFSPALEGDALAIAFPVIGWKPPWPVVEYILRCLPAGKGKPAFILYTCAGGPENAHIVAWLLLTLRGYRVTGRLWAQYPMNVVTFRIGPSALWHFLDNLVPLTRDLDEARLAGERFIRGLPAGLPFIIWPFPLFILGFLLDNPLLNRFLYWSYAWKRRCTKCALCSQCCPAERLILDENGYPKSRGACILCFSCVNRCPAHAMHLAGFSEYGNPYRSRWPELLTKKRGSMD